MAAAQREKDIENITFKPKINQNYKVNFQRPKSANSFIMKILSKKLNKNDKIEKNVHNRLIDWGKEK